MKQLKLFILPICGVVGKIQCLWEKRDLFEQRLAWPTSSTYRIPQDQDD